MRAPTATSPLAAALDAARAQHPGIAVSDEVFERWVRDRVAPGDEVEQAVASLHLADLLVACGCAHQDPSALEVFETEIIPQLADALRGVGVERGDADDVRQNVREQILLATPNRPAKITGYRGQGPLRGWLRVCAVREALAARRKIRPDQVALDDASIVDFMAADPELELAKTHASDQFRAAFSEALAELADRDKNVLRYHILDGLGTDEVARIYRVHRVTVTRWLTKARQQLLVGTRKRLSIRLGLDRRRFESLMTLIQSRLDVNLTEALGEASRARPEG
jgi:RNA polymerase sigma-70 factor (ECF subfamily)